MATYTQTAGSSTGKYFQDVAVSPVTVKDNTLFQRLNPKHFPKVGTKFTSTPDAVSVNPTSASKGAGVTLDVTILGAQLELGSTVAFSGLLVTVNSVRVQGQDERTLIANVTIGGAAINGARDVVVTSPDGGTDTLTAAFTVNT